jgi:hypothetical protein
LKLEKEKNEELAQGMETISCLKSSSGALQNIYDALHKTHKDLEVQFDALWVRLQNLEAHPKLPKHPLARVVKDVVMLILMLFVLKASNQMLSKLL